jgi:hypothetical protein
MAGGKPYQLVATRFLEFYTEGYAQVLLHRAVRSLARDMCDHWKRGTGPKRRLDCVGVGFAGANTYHMFEAVHENLAVADLSAFRARGDRLDDLVHLIG